MITDENKSLAYCHVPKAASTTWMVAFAKTNSVANFTEMLQRVALHEALLEKFAIDGEKLESNTFTFTFIRHPFHRIVSTYLTTSLIVPPVPKYVKVVRKSHLIFYANAKFELILSIVV